MGKSRFYIIEIYIEFSRFVAIGAAITIAFIYVIDFSIHGTVLG